MNGARLVCPGAPHEVGEPTGAILTLYFDQTTQSTLTRNRFIRVTAGRRCVGVEYPMIAQGHQRLACGRAAGQAGDERAGFALLGGTSPNCRCGRSPEHAVAGCPDRVSVVVTLGESDVVLIQDPRIAILLPAITSSCRRRRTSLRAPELPRHTVVRGQCCGLGPSRSRSTGERLLGDRSAEDALQTRLVGSGSRKGTNWAGRAGDIMQRPPSWAAVAALLAATGATGRRAALRGGVCYLSAAAAHLPIKALVGRRHPPGSARHQLGPVTSSFPSGHAAADLAFVFGASQEMPRAFLPLSCASLAVHWTLVRKRAHYPSDVLAGGALGAAVALAAWKLRPPRSGTEDQPGLVTEEVEPSAE